MWRFATCRASTTAWVLRSFRRPRESWPIMTHATPTSAAKCSARCSERGNEETVMSRIGKKAVAVPSGVTANVEGQTVKVKGPKGALQLVLHDDLTAKMDKGAIQIDPRFETKRSRSQWGTYRTLVAN